MPDELCLHLQAITDVRHPRRQQCDDCVKMGSHWVHLRTCQDCGGTYCCDSSPNRHARAHSAMAYHPVVASAEPNERWLYCFPDDAFTEY
jgi:hypothetical protein